MRILIDLQGTQTESRFRGIGRYSLAFAQALARNAAGHEVWLALNAAFPDGVDAIRHSFVGLIPQTRMRLFDIPQPVAEQDAANAWRARAATSLRGDFVRNLRPDVVVVTSLFEGWLDDAAVAVGDIDDAARTAVILYDLIPWLDPDTHLAAPGQRAWFERKLASLRQAGLLLAISGHSRRQAIDLFGLPPERVCNVSAAADPLFRRTVGAPSGLKVLLARLGIERPFVLYAPGGFDARKNVNGLIAAWGMTPADLRARHQLVITSKLAAGQRRQIEAAAAGAGLAPGELILAGYVNDNELAALYGATALFVYPSRYEGFGLPALEAMACGAPVIGADNSSIPEVIGCASALFDAASPANIAACVEEVLRNPVRREELRAHGLRQAARFSWDATALAALAALAALVENMPAVAAVARPPAADDIAADLLRALAAIPARSTPTDIVRVADCIAFNRPRDAAAQLLIDISEITKKDARTGIQRVVRNLLAELLDYPPVGFRVQPVYFDGARYRHAGDFLARSMARRPASSDSQAVSAADDAIADCQQDDIYLALDLNAMSDAVHACHRQLRRRGVRMHFVVYDLLLLRHPEWWPQGFADTFQNWFNKIAVVADSLVCISAVVATDVREMLREHVACPAIKSFHLGANIDSRLPSVGLPDDAATVLARLAGAPSFLMVGTLEPRKGHAQVLAAFEQLWARGTAVNLVIVGKQGWMVDALVERLRRHPEQGRRLCWLAGISDEYLEKYYAACQCLLAASEGEGFGLPLIEAARRHLPILARDIPVFREVAGNHAAWFSGLAPADLVTAIEHWLAAPAAPRSDRMPWLTWRQSARQLLQCLDLNAPAAEEAL